MAATAQAYGLIPVVHPNGQTRAREYRILNNAGTGYGTAIYYGDLVKIHTDGTLNIGDGSTDAIGVFAGCEYIDSTGKPNVSKYWPASQALLAGSVVRAFVYDDQQNIYKVGVSANGSSWTLATIGGQVDIANNGTGSAVTGNTTGSVSAAGPVGAGSTAQVRVVGFLNGEPYDATTNPFPELLVQISQHQYTADKAGL
jgi:hypothetical protein